MKKTSTKRTTRASVAPTTSKSNARRKTRERAQSSASDTSVSSVEQSTGTSVELVSESTNANASESVNPSSDVVVAVVADEGNAVEHASVDETSASTSESPDTCDESSASADASDDETTSDASVVESSASADASSDVPSLDDIASADADASAKAQAKTTAKAKTPSAPRVKRSAAPPHRAIVGADDLWTARLLYRSKRRMRLADVDVSQFPNAFMPVTLADDASDEQRASAAAQNERAKVWDVAMLDVITESNYLMANKTPAIVAFLTEMQYDASTTKTKRSANAKRSTSSAKSVSPEQVNVIAGETSAANMIESLGVKRARTALEKSSKNLDEKHKDADDYATRRAQLDAALAYVARVEAAKTAA